MRRILIILLILPFWIFGQTGITLVPDVDASHLGGFLPAYYVDTTDFAANTIRYVDASYSNRIASNGTIIAPFTTIADALLVAVSGDIILVFPGSYTEHVTFTAKPLALIGYGGYTQTFLEATVVSAAGIDVVDSVYIEGITITGDAGGAIIELAQNETGVIIRNCDINTTGSNTFGISVGAAGSVDLDVQFNIFRGNSGDGMIWLSKTNTGTIIANNTFIGADSTSGYAIQTAGMDGGRFNDNIISGFASGIFPHTVTSGSSGTFNIEIFNNTIFNCSNAIRLGHTSMTVNMDSVSVFNNLCYDNSNGIIVANDAQVLSGTFNIIGNILTRNTANYTNANTAPFNLANFIEGDLNANTITVNSDYTLPLADGNVNDIMQTNADGTMSFIANAGFAGVLGFDFSNPSMILVFTVSDTLKYSTGHGHNELRLLTDGVFNGDVVINGELTVTGDASLHASMFFNVNTSDQTPVAADTIGIINFISGSSHGFEFEAGESGTFSSTADNGADVTITTGGAHTVDVGDYVVISQASTVGSFDISGTYIVTADGGTTFDIAFADWDASETGIWQSPSQVKLTQAGVTDVDFLIDWNLSASASGTPSGDIVDWGVYVNTSPIIKTFARRTLSTSGTWGNFGGGGIRAISTNDIIYMIFVSDDVDPITHRFGSIRITQL